MSRSADACGIDFFRGSPAAGRRSLRRRGAALRQGSAAGCGTRSGCKFKIPDSKLRNRGAACGGIARSSPAGRELRASAAPGCAPLRFLLEPQIQHSRFKMNRSADACGIDFFRGSLAAERTGLRREGAALRRGAAAGCRSLCDRIYRQSFRPNKLRPARFRRTETTRKPVEAANTESDGRPAKRSPYSISRRLSIACVMVSSSTYASSSPKPLPRAIEVIFSPAKARSRLIR